MDNLGLLFPLDLFNLSTFSLLKCPFNAFSSHLYPHHFTPYYSLIYVTLCLDYCNRLICWMFCTLVPFPLPFPPTILLLFACSALRPHDLTNSHLFFITYVLLSFAIYTESMPVCNHGIFLKVPTAAGIQLNIFVKCNKALSLCVVLLLTCNTTENKFSSLHQS